MKEMKVGSVAWDREIRITNRWISVAIGIWVLAAVCWAVAFFAHGMSRLYPC